MNEILDRLLVDHPRIYGMILYVEQPFPYDLKRNRIDVHSTSARKAALHGRVRARLAFSGTRATIGLDGRRLENLQNTNGRFTVIVLGEGSWNDTDGSRPLRTRCLPRFLTCLLAAHAGTIMGVETNSMQFYPDASLAEAIGSSWALPTSKRKSGLVVGEWEAVLVIGLMK